VTEVETVETIPLEITYNNITNTYDFEITAKQTEDDLINVVGEKEIRLEDFDITPPSAVNVYEAGEEVLLRFNINIGKINTTKGI
jgi:hypothetical protein